MTSSTPSFVTPDLIRGPLRQRSNGPRIKSNEPRVSLEGDDCSKRVLILFLPASKLVRADSNCPPNLPSQKPEERRVGNERVSTSRSRWSPYPSNKNNDNNQQHQI